MLGIFTKKSKGSILLDQKSIKLRSIIIEAGIRDFEDKNFKLTADEEDVIMEILSGGCVLSKIFENNERPAIWLALEDIIAYIKREDCSKFFEYYVENKTVNSEEEIFEKFVKLHIETKTPLEASSISNLDDLVSKDKRDIRDFLIFCNKLNNPFSK